jgi:hypothetical protein
MIRASNIKIAATANAQKRTFSPDPNGSRAMTRKKMVKTSPKDFSEPILTPSFFISYS